MTLFLDVQIRTFSSNSTLNKMKTKQITSVVVLGFVVAGITFSACKKSYTPSQQSNKAIETGLTNATNNVADFDNAASEDFDLAVNDDEATASNARSPKCYMTTYSPEKGVYPYVKTVDYGSGCTNALGVTKKGKVMVTYYDPGVSEKFSVTTYDGFYINNVHVEGNVTINKSTNSSGQSVFQHITNKTLTSPDGDVNDWGANLDFTLIQGENTADKLDDIYQITGSAHGKETLDGVEANNWKSDVDKSNVVIKPKSCTRRVKGGLIVSIHVKVKGNNGDKKLDEYLDYGNGECDDNATLTINGVSQPVTLPLDFWPLRQY
jgi:hypothetical protein